MKRILFDILTLVVLITGFSSCDNIDPLITNLENYNFTKNGDKQKGIAGEFLNDSIRIYINNNTWNVIENQNNTDVKLLIKIDEIIGGGSVDKNEFILNGQSHIAIRWKLGTASTDQRILISIVDDYGKFVTRLTFTATAFKVGRWDRYEGSVFDMDADTAHQFTFAIFVNKLHMQGNNYFDWQLVESTNSLSCHSVEFDSEGTVYLGTWDGKLYKSINHGISFSECSKPIPEYSGYFKLIITDQRIWVSRFNHKLRFSDDGGKSWTQCESGLGENSQFYDIFRLKNGKFVTWEDNTQFLFTSEDGIHWIKGVKLQNYPRKLYVNEKDEIITLNDYIIMSVCVSVDGGVSFNERYNLNIAYGTFPFGSKSFFKYKDKYYIGIPGAGVVTTSKFVDFEKYYNNVDFRDLFIDHKGTLYATSFDFNKIYCFSGL